MFRRISDLKAHKTQVHKVESEDKRQENHSMDQPRKNRPWFCDYCDSTFIRPDHLKRHVENIHFMPRDPLSMDNEPSEKKYDYISKTIQRHACDICGKSFTRKDNLRKHEKRQHPEEFNDNNDEIVDVFLGHNIEDDEYDNQIVAVE